MNDQYTVDGIKINVDYELEQYWLKDYKNDIDVKVIVNWNKAVAPAKALLLLWRDKQGKDCELVLDREEVQTIMFLLAPTEDEDKYLRTKTSELKRRRHQFRIKVPKRMEKGEEFLVNKMITT